MTHEPQQRPVLHRIARRPGLCMLILAVLPVLLRLALMPFHPAPIPAGADDFSYMLLGDTLAHHRLANPTHPMHRFFETDFTLQEPTYSSIFPLGQGFAIALGQILAGHPWAGVLATQALLCALCYWMLLGWTSPGWALAGGLLAVAQFGPLCEWTNSYFGGGVSAIAGCLVFGALPRLYRRGTWNLTCPARNAIILGAGLGLQILTRPFESILLAVSVILYFLGSFRHKSTRPRLRTLVALAALAAAPAVLLTFLHNRAVTGDWLRLPYVESRYQYGVPATFTFQANPVPHRSLTREQQLDFRAQSIIHGDGPDTPTLHLQRLRERLPHYRFFIPWPLYPAVLVYLLSTFRRRTFDAAHAWFTLVILLFALGTNFYPYFYPRYIAALTCVFVLICVAGLERLHPIANLSNVVLVLCGAQFLFWYGVHLSARENLLISLSGYQSPYFVNWGDPEGRGAVQRTLTASPGKDLVFVRYSGRHLFREWVHNGADIDSSPIVWARDLGVAENVSLRNYYPDRKAWRLEPDAVPPRLAPYGDFEDQNPITFVPFPSDTPPRKPAAETSAAPAPSPPTEGVVPELPSSGWLNQRKR